MSRRADDQQVEDLRRDNARLRQELERSEAERARVERERARLERENVRLKDELEAAPFSKGAPTRRPRRPGRKPGRAYGRRGQRPVPTVVHETHDVPVPETCPDCGGRVRETHVATQYHEDLPPVVPVVRRFEIQLGACADCHRGVQRRHPLQTSDALGAAAVQLGPQAIALAVSLNKQFGLSFGKIATVFRTRFGLHVTPSALVRALHRAAAKGQRTYAALSQTVRTSAVVVPDETGWKVNGLSYWLWAFATATTTVYCIRRGRGFDDAAAVLGADFAGGLSRDGWAPHRQFTDAFHSGFRDADRALDTFDFDFNKKMNRVLIYELATARFIQQREDALFLGPPGTGKSHLAQAIGRAAIQQGYRVVYREAHLLIERNGREFLFSQPQRNTETGGQSPLGDMGLLLERFKQLQVAAGLEVHAWHGTGG